MSSWFIAPWETTRILLEAQQRMAQFFCFGLNRASAHRETVSQEKNAAVGDQATPSNFAFSEAAVPETTNGPVSLKTAAARSGSKAVKTSRAVRSTRGKGKGKNKTRKA
jgi:hypothetical protein